LYGFGARELLKRLAKLPSKEWEKPYPTVRGFINAQVSIALVRATNRCTSWEGGTGLGLSEK